MLLDDGPPLRKASSMHTRSIMMEPTSLFQGHHDDHHHHNKHALAPFALSASCHGPRKRVSPVVVEKLPKTKPVSLLDKPSMSDSTSDTTALTYSSTTGHSSADFSLPSQEDSLVLGEEEPQQQQQQQREKLRRRVRFCTEPPLIVTTAAVDTNVVWYSPREILGFKQDLRNDRDAFLQREKQRSTSNNRNTDLGTLWWAYIVAYNKQHIEWSEHPPLSDPITTLGLEKWIVHKLQPLVHLRRQRLYREIADLQQRPLPAPVRQRLVKRTCATMSACSTTFALYLASCAAVVVTEQDKESSYS